MKFSIERNIFLKGLARVQGIVEKRNTLPILSNVLIDARDGEIFLTATDLEVGMQASYPADIEVPGKVTVSAKKLHEIIKELSDETVSFTAKDNCWIEIKCGKALFNIVGLSPEEFPYFPKSEDTAFFDIKSSTLKKMIEKTAFSICTDDTKYNLNGIYFKSFDNEDSNYLRLVATDGHRLSLIQENLDVSEIEELEKGVIFPRKGVFELKKIADDGDSDIKLGFMDNNAVIKKDKTIVVMRLVDGEFPNYERVIPKTHEMQAVIPKNNLFHALRRISILSSEKSRGVKILLKNGCLEISSSNPELGDAREDLEADYDGPEISIGFNARYLLDIIQVQEADNIVLLIKDDLSPLLVKPQGDDNYQAVVMPMRL